MKNLTAAGAANTLKNLHQSGDLVDSHQFEREAMQHCQTAFALDFLGYIANSDPLHSFSLNFGRWIQRELDGQIAPTQRVTSLNLRNNAAENQEWRIL